jgi:tetratricopeptide (TPR) repeat protein
VNRHILLFLALSFIIAAAPLSTAPAQEDQDFQKGYSLLKEGKYRESIEYLKKALQQREDPAIYLNIGSAYYALKEYEEAAASYKKALAIRPDYKKARVGLAASYLAQGKDQEALKNYLESVSQSEEDSQIYLALAATSQRQKEQRKTLSSQIRKTAMRKSYSPQS